MYKAVSSDASCRFLVNETSKTTQIPGQVNERVYRASKVLTDESPADG